MNCLISILLLFLFHFGITQNVYYFEMINGDAYDYSFSSKYIKMIEENQPDSLLKFISPKFKIDTSLFRKECAYTAKNFSSKDCIYKNLNDNYSGTQHFYTRKFFQYTNGIERPLFVVAFKLVSIKEISDIDSLTFVCDTTEVKKPSDLVDKRKLLSKPLPKLPPLPPPPPDSLVKQLKKQ